MVHQKNKKAKASGPVSAYLAEIGRRGGQVKVPKGAAVLTPEERTARAKKMAEARWKGHKATAQKKSKASARAVKP